MELLSDGKPLVKGEFMTLTHKHFLSSNWILFYFIQFILLSPFFKKLVFLFLSSNEQLGSEDVISFSRKTLLPVCLSSLTTTARRMSHGEGGRDPRVSSLPFWELGKSACQGRHCSQFICQGKGATPYFAYEFVSASFEKFTLNCKLPLLTRKAPVPRVTALSITLTSPRLLFFNLLKILCYFL